MASKPVLKNLLNKCFWQKYQEGLKIAEYRKTFLLERWLLSSLNLLPTAPFAFSMKLRLNKNGCTHQLSPGIFSLTQEMLGIIHKKSF